ncbi:MAG: type 1 glutamine amidotransferase domain-containing protein [Sphingobacteriales bacterium 50-39]|nr:type 1 glutamine amidotransferase domain-containing protein [Sphingobacteriales bacterium]OJW60839.1 MAG: type 1 glutamine amidotransferase domain-containing protein [Sphingobacteriales bacterium 50-39]
MSATISILHPQTPKRILLVAANPAISGQTGWEIGFWASELIHSYWAFVEKGYTIEIVSPEGGKVIHDSWSDPRDKSGYSEHDILSLGFLCSPRHAALLENTKSISKVSVEDYDAIFVAGGQSPMYTFIDNAPLQKLLVSFYEADKITAVVCHATCMLLKTKLSDGSLLVKGKTWTGFANTEEDYADNFVKQKIQPFRIEDEAKKMANTNFITGGMFWPFALRDGNLITGQQQYSAALAAGLVIEALGV